MVRPGGVIAVWCYQLHTIGPEVDAVVHRLYSEILGDSGRRRTRLVEEGYRTLPFPFEEITPPSFCLVQRWDVNRLAALMGTWSASLRFRKETGRDALDEVRDELAAA